MKNSVEGFLQLPNLTPQSAMFDFLDINTNVYLISNHSLLIFKFYIYKARSTKEVNFNILKIKIKKVQGTEKNISKNNADKYAKYKKKWQILEHALNT